MGFGQRVADLRMRGRYTHGMRPRYNYMVTRFSQYIKVYIFSLHNFCPHFTGPDEFFFSSNFHSSDGK